MLGFKQFLAEDRPREGELLKDIQDLRRQTQLLRQKMMIQKEMEKYKLETEKRKERDRIKQRLGLCGLK